MHASTPYLYLKRTIPTLEVTGMDTRKYLKNKRLSLAGLFILKQLFMSFAANISSAVKFHKLLKAGVPILSITKTNLPLYHLSKVCPPADIISYILVVVI